MPELVNDRNYAKPCAASLQAVPARGKFHIMAASGSLFIFKMKEKEIEKKYGKKITKKIIEKMEGQTVGLNKDGSLDYYEWDVVQAYNELTHKSKINNSSWD